MTWFLVDEAALHRCTGTAEVMASQLDRLLEVAADLGYQLLSPVRRQR